MVYTKPGRAVRGDSEGERVKKCVSWGGRVRNIIIFWRGQQIQGGVPLGESPSGCLVNLGMDHPPECCHRYCVRNLRWDELLIIMGFSPCPKWIMY